MTTRTLRDRIIERVLFLCAALSVLTTGGIIAVLAFETFEFLREVPVARLPDRHRVDAAVLEPEVRRAAAGGRHHAGVGHRHGGGAAHGPAVGHLPERVLAERLPPRRQAGARDPGRRADGGLRLLRAHVRDAAAAAGLPHPVGLQRLEPRPGDGPDDPAAGVVAVRRRDARRAARPARGLLRAGRDAHADRAQGRGAGRVLGHHRRVHPRGVARDWRDDDRRDCRRPAAAAHRQSVRADRNHDRLHRPGVARRHAAGDDRVPHHLRGRHAAVRDDVQR